MATEVEEVRKTGYRILPPDEAVAFFDSVARDIVGMSGEEFIARWDAGEYADVDLDETPEGRQIIHLALLIPFGRQKLQS
jgi:hypothetical protein